MNESQINGSADTSAPLKGLPWSQSDESNLRLFARQGMTAKAAARLLGRPLPGVKFKAMELGESFHGINQPPGVQLRRFHGVGATLNARPTGGSMHLAGMHLSAETVTPDMATQWLENNTANRTLREGAVNRYATDMGTDSWLTKPVAVCFDETGSLANGQHTLSAIVKAKRAQLLLIARNVPRAVVAVMDQGSSRSVKDTAHFLGIEASNRSLAIARMAAYGHKEGQATLSHDQVMRAADMHKEAIAFAMVNMPHKVASSAASVIARAWYTADRTRLVAFCKLVADPGEGVAGKGENAATRLAFWLATARTGGCGGRSEVYNKAQAALHAFLAGRDIAKLREVAGDVFPVPEVAHG